MGRPPRDINQYHSSVKYLKDNGAPVRELMRTLRARAMLDSKKRTGTSRRWREIALGAAACCINQLIKAMDKQAERIARAVHSQLDAERAALAPAPTRNQPSSACECGLELYETLPTDDDGWVHAHVDDVISVLLDHIEKHEL